MKTIAYHFRAILFTLICVQLSAGYTVDFFKFLCNCDCNSCCCCAPQCTPDMDCGSHSDHDESEHEECNCTAVPQKADKTPQAVTISYRTSVSSTLFPAVLPVVTLNHSCQTKSALSLQNVFPISPPHISTTVLRI